MLGSEIRVEKVLVGELIIGVVVDVLGHVRVEHFKSSGVRWIPGSAWHFVVWNSPEFVVLHPKVGLENFRCGCEPEQSRVARSEAAAALFRALLCQGIWASG